MRTLNTFIIGLLWGSYEILFLLLTTEQMLSLILFHFIQPIHPFDCQKKGCFCCTNFPSSNVYSLTEKDFLDRVGQLFDERSITKFKKQNWFTMIIISLKWQKQKFLCGYKGFLELQKTSLYCHVIVSWSCLNNCILYDKSFNVKYYH